MRYAPLLSFALLALSGCVAPVPTSTTYVTPATTTTYTTPATRTTVMNAPPGYQPGYVAPQPTTTVIRTLSTCADCAGAGILFILSSFLFNMGEAGSRVETLPQAGNPYAPKTEEHERWWAEIAERLVSNDRTAVDD